MVLAPEKLSYTSWEGQAGRGDKIPEPGEADALLEERRGNLPPHPTPRQTRNGVSVQLQGEDHLCVGAKGTSWPNQASLHSLCHLALPHRALPTLGPGLSRDRMAANGMYGWECTSEGLMLPFCLLEVPVNLPLASGPQPSLGSLALGSGGNCPIPRAEPSQAASQSLCF